MATGSCFTPRTQSCSHCSSWGQTRPQTAGKLLVSLSLAMAPAGSPAAIILTTAGMSIPTGQPRTHLGFLHSRQRLASSMAMSMSYPRVTSSKLAARCFAGWQGISVRGIFGAFGFLAGRSPWTVFVTSDNCGHRPVARSRIRPSRMRQISVQRLLLLLEVLPLTGHQQVEVDLVPVELRPVDADELGLAANADPAAATHAGAVHHDRVEADDGLDAILCGGPGAELHHDGWADRVGQVDAAGFAELLERLGDQTLAAAAAVISGDYQLITDLPHLVLPEQQALVAGAEDGDDPVAGLFERPGDGIDRRHPDAAPGADDRAHFVDLARHAQRTDEVAERVAFAQCLQMARRRADRLDDDGDGARLAVEIGDGERDPLPLFVDHQDDELSWLAGCGDRRSLDDLHVHVIRIVDSLKNLVHILFLPSGCQSDFRPFHRGSPMPRFIEAKVLRARVSRSHSQLARSGHPLPMRRRYPSASQPPAKRVIMAKAIMKGPNGIAVLRPPRFVTISTMPTIAPSR